MKVAIFQVGHAQDANWSAQLGLQHPKAAAPDPEAALVLDRPPTSLVGIGTK